jgi:hypothetical protein
MTVADLLAIKDLIGTLGLGAIIGIGIGFVILKDYVPSYLGEKGKNLATREDIAKITREVESVKNEYRLLVEELKQRHQLRMAAVDRRLDAHQQAFALWRELVANTYTDDLDKVVQKCQTWWEQNCLFLEPAPRQAFISAYGAALSHKVLTRAGSGRSPTELQAINDSWERISTAGEIILTAVALPGLTETERDELQKAKQSPQ